MADSAASDAVDVGGEALPPEVHVDGLEGGGGELREALESGALEWPPVLSWNDWQTWRRDRGGRPAVPPRASPLYTPFMRREARLWREITQA
eukprot:1826637-Alexandrium_andersonii.AAC.1